MQPPPTKRGGTFCDPRQCGRSGLVPKFSVFRWSAGCAIFQSGAEMKTEFCPNLGDKEQADIGQIADPGARRPRRTRSGWGLTMHIVRLSIAAIVAVSVA